MNDLPTALYRVVDSFFEEQGEGAQGKKGAGRNDQEGGTKGRQPLRRHRRLFASVGSSRLLRGNICASPAKNR